MKNKQKLFSDILLLLGSSILQAYVVNAVIVPSKFAATGVTGLAILINNLTRIINFEISVPILLLLLNVPLAFLCLKSINLKFIIKSLFQIVLTAFFVSILSFPVMFKDVILNTVIGGALFGICVILAIKADGCTGGTDFIALYVANKNGKSIWSYVFCFNCLMIISYGWLYNFEIIGYSIIFQFISTAVIEKFYDNFKQITLQITTKKPQEIAQAYTERFKHGMSITKGYGAYSKQEVYLCYTVINKYEYMDVIDLIHHVDPSVLINVFNTYSFFGSFYRDKIGEYQAGISKQK